MKKYKKMWEVIKGEKKKQRKREQFYARRRAMYGHWGKQKSLEEALLAAARHAKLVSSKTHLIPDSKFRIGEFVTALRREIRETNTYGGRHLIRDLSDKDMWNDILELRGKQSAGSYSYEELSSAVMSVRLKLMNKSTAENIDDGLKAVNNDINDAINMLKDIESINDEAEVILNDFKELAKNM